MVQIYFFRGLKFTASSVSHMPSNPAGITKALSKINPTNSTTSSQSRQYNLHDPHVGMADF